MHIAVLLIAAATLGLVAHATQFQPPDVFLHSIAQPRYIPKQEKYAGLAIWESLSDDDDDVDRPDMTQQRADMMVEFAESYGASYKVEFRLVNGTFKMLAKERLTARHPILFIPAKLILTPHNIETDAPGMMLPNIKAVAPLRRANPFIYWLAYQAHRGPSSIWHKWIGSLPRNYSHLPAYWPERKAPLLGTSSRDFTTASGQRYDWMNRNLSSSIFLSYLHLNRLSDNYIEYLKYFFDWAHATFLTRAEKHPDGPFLPVGSPRGLVQPSFDGSGARPWLEERGFSLWVDRDYGVGEEVTLDYSHYTVAELNDMGLAPPLKSIRVTLPVREYLADRGRALSYLFHTSFSMNITLLRPAISAVNVPVNNRPDTLMWVLRILNLDVEHVDAVGPAMATGDPISLMNEFNTFRDAIRLLERCQSDFWLKKPNSGQRKKQAYEIQRMRYLACTQVIGNFKQMWRRLLRAELSTVTVPQFFNPMYLKHLTPEDAIGELELPLSPLKEESQQLLCEITEETAVTLENVPLFGLHDSKL